jgi:tRNA pseudouridine13 synthase
VSSEARGAPSIADAWRAAAIDPPHVLGVPSATGQLRQSPQDFVVEERLGFAPDGGTAHLLLRVEKTDANTLFVARALARFGGIRPADVGFAGLKDRRAVAMQWFSVPARLPAEAWQAFGQPGFRVLEAHPHSRKLKRGALAGNGFHIVVRELAGEVGSMTQRLEQVARVGAPNYFGPQRFGREAANLGGVRAWLDTGELPRGRDDRGFILSAARALAFNAVLAERVRDGTWDRLLPGEVANLEGSASVFVAETIDATLAARAQALDLHPTGPLPGRGGMRPVGEAAEVESRALEPLGAVVAALEEAGLEAARRPLRHIPGDLQWAFGDGSLQLTFTLPRGAFATALLREIVGFEAVALPE